MLTPYAPYSETNTIDINKDVETQKELTEITGKLTVPVTVIGEDHITGYDREKIASILDRILSPE